MPAGTGSPTRSADERRLARLGLGAAVLVGAALRFYALGAESLWYDELFSVTVANTLSTTGILFRLPLAESHPPLYFALLRWWTLLVGSSEFALRSLSVLFGVAAVPLLYAVAREAFDARVAVLAAFVLALSPFHVEFSQQARMYSLFAALTLASYYALLRLRNDGDRAAAAYVFATALLMYTHVFGLFVVLAQNAYVLAARLLPANRESLDLRRWARLQTLTGVLVAPWLAVLLARVADVSGAGASPVSWIPKPGLVSLFATPVRYVTSLRYFVGGQRGPTFPLAVLLLVVVAVLVALALYRTLLTEVNRPGEYYRSLVGDASDRLPTPPSVDRALLLVSWLAVPVVVPFLVSHLVVPVFVHRYTIPASMALYVLVAKGARTVRRDPLRYLLVGVLVVGLVAPLPAYYGATQQEQWREASQYVDSHVDGDDVVLHATDASRVRTRDIIGTAPAAHYLRAGMPTATVPLGANASRIRRLTRGYDRVLVVVSHDAPGRRERFLARLSADRERCGHRSYVGLEAYCFE